MKAPLRRGFRVSGYRSWLPSRDGTAVPAHRAQVWSNARVAAGMRPLGGYLVTATVALLVACAAALALPATSSAQAPFMHAGGAYSYGWAEWQHRSPTQQTTIATSSSAIAGEFVGIPIVGAGGSIFIVDLHCTAEDHMVITWLFGADSISATLVPDVSATVSAQGP